MQKSTLRRMERYTKRNGLRRIWNKFVRIMACVVVFCTTYALILPAITMEQVYTCGLEEHTHTDSCYVIPTQPPTDPTSPETETGEPPAETEETVPDATETERVLVCELAEHIHDASCVSDPNADLETAEQWESITSQVSLSGNWPEDLLSISKTQLGYEESGRNYLTEDGILKKGYTRYGEWFGIPYGDWDAMFVSFCLHYAGIPQEAVPYDSNSRDWMDILEEEELLGNRDPQVGEPVFYLRTGGNVYKAGILSGIDYENDPNTGEPVVSQLRIIAGDADNRVAEITVKPDQLAGYCDLEKARVNYDALQKGSPVQADAPAVFANPGETVFQFTTANPADLKEGVDYAVYFGSNDNLTFLTTIGYVDSTAVPGTGY